VKLNFSPRRISILITLFPISQKLFRYQNKTGYEPWLELPKGKKCIYVSSSESEIIFPRNKELTIGKAELNIFKYPEGYIECLVIPAEMR